MLRFTFLGFEVNVLGEKVGIREDFKIALLNLGGGFFQGDDESVKPWWSVIGMFLIVACYFRNIKYSFLFSAGWGRGIQCDTLQVYCSTKMEAPIAPWLKTENLHLRVQLCKTKKLVVFCIFFGSWSTIWCFLSWCQRGYSQIWSLGGILKNDPTGLRKLENEMEKAEIRSNYPDIIQMFQILLSIGASPDSFVHDVLFLFHV